MAIITNKDYLTKSLAKFNTDASDIELVFLDYNAENAGSNLDPDGAVNVTACKLLMYKYFSKILPVYNMSDNGFSMSWDVEKLKLWYNALCIELGKPNTIVKPKPSIRDRSNYH